MAGARALIDDHGLVPEFVAGHSVGAFAAAVTAGVLTLAEALAAVELRGRSMEQACAQGDWGMAAVIGLPTRAAAELVAEVGTDDDPLWVANVNADVVGPDVGDQPRDRCGGQSAAHTPITCAYFHRPPLRRWALCLSACGDRRRGGLRRTRNQSMVVGAPGSRHAGDRRRGCGWPPCWPGGLTVEIVNLPAPFVDDGP